MSLFDIFKKDIKIYIETGTWTGHSIQKAIDAGFNKIYSCDINQECVDKAKKLYKNYSNVFIECNPSKIALANFLMNINERCVFFLDGHFMPYDEVKEDLGFGKETSQENLPPSPILDEIDIISYHNIKSHIILIDDYKCFGSWVFGRITFDQVRNKIGNINPAYSWTIVGNTVCFYL
jgi:hypothetical protein